MSRFCCELSDRLAIGTFVWYSVYDGSNGFCLKSRCPVLLLMQNKAIKKVILNTLILNGVSFKQLNSLVVWLLNWCVFLFMREL